MNRRLTIDLKNLNLDRLEVNNSPLNNTIITPRQKNKVGLLGI